MSPTLDFKTVAPAADAARRPLLQYLDDCRLPDALVELVQLRVSQLNGCAYCVDRHTRILREMGVGSRKLATVVTWRDAPFFSDRERVALAWAEAVTAINEASIPEALDEAVEAEFTDEELVDLTFAIASMNMSNRVSVPFHRAPPTE